MFPGIMILFLRKGLDELNSTPLLMTRPKRYQILLSR